MTQPKSKAQQGFCYVLGQMAITLLSFMGKYIYIGMPRDSRRKTIYKLSPRQFETRGHLAQLTHVKKATV